jgi:hypothetical protein
MKRELAASITSRWDPHGPGRPWVGHSPACLAPGADGGAHVYAVCRKAAERHDESAQLRLPVLARNFPEHKSAFLLSHLFDQAAFRPAHPPPCKRSIPF